METVKINEVKSMVGKSGKRYYQVTLDDGRKASTFDSSVSDLGGAMVGANLIQNGSFLNIKVETIIAKPDRASEVAILPNTNHDKELTKASISNPIFVYMGACSLMSGLISGIVSSGVSDAEAVQKAKEMFSDVYQIADELYATHMELAKVKESANKLMN